MERRWLGKVGFGGEMGVWAKANEKDVEIGTQAKPQSLRLALPVGNTHL